MTYNIIELEGMEFHSRHGCLGHERTEGNFFTVDFRGETDFSKAAESDSLEDTADYGKIYDITAREMAEASNLLENVAGRIVKAVKKEFPQFSSITVRVSKRNPPVAGKAGWSRVTITDSDK
ncbi:MAG: dihydroneopterin aldolase [Candidatus Cryptobacteroides sp.]